MPKPNEQLDQFIARARAQGKTSDQIRELLRKAGWSAELIGSSLVSSDDLVAPPPPAPKSSGREVFFSLLTFLTLGTSAVALGGIIFAFINSVYPDLVARPYYDPSRAVRPALASFIVAAPVFAFLSWRFVKDVAARVASLRSGIRRVLTYLALFLASATIIGDVIALIQEFLAGTVNARFSLKVGVILLIGGWIIWYYWTNLRREERAEAIPVRWHKFHGLAFGIVALAALVVGFSLSGNPTVQQRVVRDAQRVSDLESLYYGVQGYYQQNEALPATLDVVGQGYVGVAPYDPLTGAAYEYALGEGSLFSLCAVFETDDAARAITPEFYPSPVPNVNWTHPAGRYCFTLDATPIVPLR